MLLPEAPGADEDLVQGLGVRHAVAERGDVRALVASHADDDGPPVARRLHGRRRGGRRGRRRGLVVDDGAQLLLDGAVGLRGRHHDGIGAFAEGDGRADRDGARRRLVALLVDLDAVEGHRDLGHALARGHQRRHHARFLRHAGAVFGVAERHGQRRGLLVVDGPHLLLGDAVGIRGRDDHGVLALAKLDGQVHGRRGRAGLLARDLDPVEGDGHAAHALAPRGEPGQGHRLVVEARLIDRRGERHLERNRLWRRSGRG